MFKSRKDEIHRLQLQVKELQNDQNRNGYLIRDKNDRIEEINKDISRLDILTDKTLENHKKKTRERGFFVNIYFK